MAGFAPAEFGSWQDLSGAPGPFSLQWTVGLNTGTTGSPLNLKIAGFHGDCSGVWSSEQAPCPHLQSLQDLLLSAEKFSGVHSTWTVFPTDNLGFIPGIPLVSLWSLIYFMSIWSPDCSFVIRKHYFSKRHKNRTRPMLLLHTPVVQHCSSPSAGSEGVQVCEQ